MQISGRMLMDAIHNENDYQDVMRRIDQLCFETDEDTPIDDPRMQEIDTLVSSVESYEKEYLMSQSTVVN